VNALCTLSSREFISCCENAPKEYGADLILEGKLEIHPLLGSTKKTKITALNDIYGMRWENDNLG
jgi:hypothetical protein